jgi:DNA-binding NtrC family response regulator
MEKKKNIAVVDDHTIICDIIERILEKKGHEVTKYNSYDFVPGSYDIYFLDFEINGSNISGEDWLQHHKNVVPAYKRICMSGNGCWDESTLEKVCIIKKPFSVNEIYTALDQVEYLKNR